MGSPTLVYDGDCAICRYWVAYWHELTQERVVYRPYQEAAADFPGITPESFARSIQLIESDGQIHAGAAAAFRVLRHAAGRSAWWWLYARCGPFAALSEGCYAFFARHRNLLSGLSRFLWGSKLHAERYELLSWVFLRLFATVYIAAFASLGVQVQGLFGHQGILPVSEYLAAAHEAYGGAAYRDLPSLFWLNSSDTALLAGTIIGVLLGLFVLIDRCTRPALIALYLLYLSYVCAGQDFLSFQWDSLLLEVGFLAIFLSSGSKIIVWLFRWLVFRYVFLAGIVKLLYGDKTWHGLTALQYHFWTQPLPTPFAWYAARLPDWLLTAGTAAALIIELVVIFLIFLPRRLRAAAGCSVLLLQALIVLTGNYNFFNLLSMMLCLFLFDDAALRRALPQWLQSLASGRAQPVTRAATLIAALLALLIVPVGLNRIFETFEHRDLPVLGAVTRFVAPLSIVNPYGLFAMMTTTRPEIAIEGSNDGQVWREYVFRYKPGPLTRPLMWNIPHQPRLDWQMWFAALGGVRDSPWLVRLVQRLLQASPPVLALLEPDPFGGVAPKFVRAQLYDYRFADPVTRAQTGQIWVRRPQGLFFRPVSLADFEH